jgi:hypothetical protein
MAGSDRQNGVQDRDEEREVATPDATTGADDAPTNVGPNLPRQVERNAKDAGVKPPPPNRP